MRKSIWVIAIILGLFPSLSAAQESAEVKDKPSETAPAQMHFKAVQDESGKFTLKQVPTPEASEMEGIEAQKKITASLWTQRLVHCA